MLAANTLRGAGRPGGLGDNAAACMDPAHQTTVARAAVFV